jgi:hypothetical protein
MRKLSTYFCSMEKDAIQSKNDRTASVGSILEFLQSLFRSMMVTTVFPSVILHMLTKRGVQVFLCNMPEFRSFPRYRGILRVSGPDDKTLLFGRIVRFKTHLVGCSLPGDMPHFKACLFLLDDYLLINSIRGFPVSAVQLSQFGNFFCCQKAAFLFREVTGYAHWKIQIITQRVFDAFYHTENEPWKMYAAIPCGVFYRKYLFVGVINKNNAGNNINDGNNCCTT